MGRPLLYGTTPLFLEQFALRHLGELPRGDELAIALRDPNEPPREPSVEIPAETITDQNPPAEFSTQHKADASA